MTMEERTVQAQQGRLAENILYFARALRAASPTATPNSRLVALADAALGRGGRMKDAIATIGRGEACFEGTPFALELRKKSGGAWA